MTDWQDIPEIGRIIGMAPLVLLSIAVLIAWAWQDHK